MAPARRGEADEYLQVLEAAQTEALARVADLEAEAAGIAESTAESPDDESDPEGSTVGFERARVAALLEQARRGASELAMAIERVRSGDFGTCEGCGRPIGAERLAALPETRRCVECAGGRTTPR